MNCNCSVCLEELDIENTKATACGHKFHKDCIKEWLMQSLTCPMCRTELELTPYLEDYGSDQMDLTEDKIILIIGQRGSGKTTLVNDYVRRNHSEFYKIVTINPLRDHMYDSIMHNSYDVSDLFHRQNHLIDMDFELPPPRMLLIIDNVWRQRIIKLKQLCQLPGVTLILTSTAKSVQEALDIIQLPDYHCTIIHNLNNRHLEAYEHEVTVRTVDDHEVHNSIFIYKAPNPD